MLKRRYKCTGKIEDLEEAIQVAWQAADVTPKDHPDLAAMLSGLDCKEFWQGNNGTSTRSKRGRRPDY